MKPEEMLPREKDPLERKPGERPGQSLPWSLHGGPPIPRLQALGLQNCAASVSCSKPPSRGRLGQQPAHSVVLSRLGLRALEGASQEIWKKPLHFPSWL